MKKTFIVLALILLVIILDSCKKDESILNPIVTYPSFGVKTYYGSNSDIAVSSVLNQDGSIVFTGYTVSSGAGDNDIVITKIDASGNILWKKTYGGSGNDQANQIIQASDNGQVIVGQVTSFNADSKDVFAMKIDEQGNLTWAKLYKWNGDQYGNSIVTSNSGSGYVITGYSEVVPQTTNTAVLVMEISADGSYVSHKFYGGVFNDYAYKIIKTSDAGYLIAGNTYSFAAPNGDAYLLKLYSDATINWSSIYGGANADIAYDVITTGNDYVAAGLTYSFQLNSGDALIFKTDPQGYMYAGWPRTLGSDAFKLDLIKSIALLSDGTYTLTGYSVNASNIERILVANYYADASFNWAKVYGGTLGEDIGYNVLSYSDGIILTGSSISFGISNKDMILMNLKKDGSTCLTSGSFNALGGSPSASVIRVTTEQYNYSAPEVHNITPAVLNSNIYLNTNCSY